MSNTTTTSKDSDTFDSGRLMRKIERERRLREIERTFQNIAEEAKQTQEDIYSNVFTERGQMETLENHTSSAYASNQRKASVQQNGGNTSMLSRVSEMVIPNRPKNTPPAFEMSPTGVASFPEIGPVGVAHKKYHSHNLPWNNDGPGFGARLTNAKVQDQMFKSFFSMQSNSKKIIFIVLFVSFLVTLLVTLIDVSEGPDIELSKEGWEKLYTIRPQLIDQNVEKQRLYDYKSVHFASLVWLSNEATTVTIADSRELLERYVMLVFYYSTKGDSWEKNNMWLVEGTSICKWHGVTCSSSAEDASQNEGVVESLNLHSNKLDGTMTDEISKLKGLRRLVLSNNNLFGKVPSSLGDLSSLQTLELAENTFTGVMPETICELKDRDLSKLISDCGGQDKDIECYCCTECSP